MLTQCSGMVYANTCVRKREGYNNGHNKDRKGLQRQERLD